jgi:putative ATPase
MEELGYGQDYKYSHDYPGNFVQQEFMPTETGHPTFWTPCHNPSESKMAERMNTLWNKNKI